MLGEDQADYDGLSPQEQIDIFDRVSRRTAVTMIEQIEALKAEIAKLRDSDAANLRTIQDARKALGLPPVGCQPGDKVDAGLVAEIAKLRQSVARLEWIERAAVAIVDYEVNSTDQHIHWDRYYSDLRKAVLAVEHEWRLL